MNSTKHLERNGYRRTLTGNLLLWSLVMVLPVLLWSCDSVSDFGDMNKDPNSPTSIDPALQFTNLQLETSYNMGQLQRSNWYHAGPLIQSVTAPVAPYNFYRFNRQWSEHFFLQNYGSKQRELVDLLTKLRAQKEDGQKVDNKIAATRVLRVYLFHRITDLYGDVPYFEAGKGASELNFTPAYDPQSEIYPDMLKELSEAAEQFDPAQPAFSDSDLIYNGDIEKWRKFANSLRLRLALRLVEVDPAMAEQEAVAALNAPGGVMSSNDDIAYMNKTDRNADPFANGNSLTQEEGQGIFYITQTMVEWLRDRNDPRLSIFAAIMDTDQATVPEAPNHVVSTAPGDQLGMPSGYSTADEGAGTITNHPSYSVAVQQSPTPEEPMNGYSKLNPVMWKYDAPFIYQTYAEVELMRAEMAARGWTAEPAAAHYENGVRAALQHLAMYNGGTGTTVSAGQIDTYLTNNPYDPANAMEQINEQYWVATFMDFIEGWANQRRSGYPDLEPAKVDSPEWPENNASGDKWPRRMIYPNSEQDENGEHYQEAMSRQGMQGLPSDITVPVWWDAEAPISN